MHVQSLTVSYGTRALTFFGQLVFAF